MDQELAAALCRAIRETRAKIRGHFGQHGLDALATAVHAIAHRRDHHPVSAAIHGIIRGYGQFMRHAGRGDYLAGERAFIESIESGLTEAIESAIDKAVESAIDKAVESAIDDSAATDGIIRGFEQFMRRAGGGDDLAFVEAKRAFTEAVKSGLIVAIKSAVDEAIESAIDKKIENAIDEAIDECSGILNEDERKELKKKIRDYLEKKRHPIIDAIKKLMKMLGEVLADIICDLLSDIIRGDDDDGGDSGSALLISTLDEPISDLKAKMEELPMFVRPMVREHVTVGHATGMGGSGGHASGDSGGHASGGNLKAKMEELSMFVRPMVREHVTIKDNPYDFFPQHATGMGGSDGHASGDSDDHASDSGLGDALVAVGGVVLAVGLAGALICSGQLHLLPHVLRRL